ncbi:hypothetical protein RvY_07222 [Ramazzottius varieornatus]|uniref:Uncharacterized protein n=1 Tax=Ramazzottius varieornatus TaxID=947166 RepID=A0A1D1V1C0_RAMVA|nr:hypothetical protein RvY_07222 [Ramazzottius varieornatus]
MADLDDFFAKKDKKKPKKKDDTLKAADLFKALDNAALNIETEEDEERRNKRDLQLGAVLSEVVNVEELSKWSEPMEEEQLPDLSNLKFESIITPDESEETVEASKEEAARTAKPVWGNVKTEVETTLEKISGTPADFAPVVEDVKLVERTKKKDVTKEAEALKVTISDVQAGSEGKEKGAEEGKADIAVKEGDSADQHQGGILESVAKVVGNAAGTLVGTAIGLLQSTTTTDEGKGDTEKAPEADKEKPTGEGNKSDEPKKYIPPSLRKKMEEEAAAAKLKPAALAPAPNTVVTAAPVFPSAEGKYISPAVRKAMEEEAKKAAVAPSSSSPTPPAASTPSAPASSGGAYVSIGQRKAMEEERMKASGGTAVPRQSYKQPQLDNKEEFPSLGGPARKK